MISEQMPQHYHSHAKLTGNCFIISGNFKCIDLIRISVIHTMTIFVKYW